MTNVTDLPAVLGGSPLRPEGPPRWPPHDPEIIAALQRAAADGAWGHYHGPRCAELQRVLCEFHDVEHAWLCSSGTAAVELALRGVGVGPGDEVILAAYDFKANFINVLALGATPVLVDVERGDWQLDVSLIDTATSDRTRAIIASHLHGGGVDLFALRDVIGDRSIAIVEDACQCPGAQIGGRRAGTIGDVGVLSFGGSKLTAAGRGGALLTRNAQILERIRRHVLRGNDLSPLSELQAAVLIPQWHALEERNQHRTASVALLSTVLSPFPFLRMLTAPSAASATGYYKVGFEHSADECGGLPRDLFCRAMRAEGISLWPGFRGLHKIHSARRFRTPGQLPVADGVDESIVVLHHPVLLGTDDEMQQVAIATEKVRQHAALIRARASELLAEVPVNYE